MYIKRTIEVDDGTIEFEGTLTPEEARVVIEAGLCYLFKVGVLPFKSITNDKAYSFSPDVGRS